MQADAIVREDSEMSNRLPVSSGKRHELMQASIDVLRLSPIHRLAVGFLNESDVCGRQSS